MSRQPDGTLLGTWPCTPRWFRNGRFGLVARCPECFTQHAPGQELPSQYTPVYKSWDGTDLCLMRNYPNQQVFCSRRVLDLARRDRWSNARFDPMDFNRDHVITWPGIDYLGAEWPPAKWYPDAPSAGKSLEEWLEQMRSPDWEVARLARIALTDLGAVAVPSLTLLLDDDSEDLRRHAARMLYFVNKHHPLSGELKRRVLPLLPQELSSVWLRSEKST